MNSSITIQDMNIQVERIAMLRSQEAEASRVKKELSDALELEERKMMEMLESSGMTNYNSPYGKVVMAFRTSVKTPKTDQDKAAFYNWLREKGLYESLISVNSQTINSLYKSEMEEARERGDQDFTIPGLTEVTIVPQLRFSSN